MREYDERDAQIWGEAPPRDAVDAYARENDPFYKHLGTCQQCGRYTTDRYCFATEGCKELGGADVL